MKANSWWIKQRFNPQLGTYYVACGQMSKTAAKRYENPMYGDNVMHRFDAESDYQERISALKQHGEAVQ